MKKNFIKIIFVLAFVITLFGINFSNNVNAEEPFVETAQSADLTFKLKVEWVAKNKNIDTSYELVRVDTDEVVKELTVPGGEEDFVSFEPVPSVVNGKDVRYLYNIREKGTETYLITLNGNLYDVSFQNLNSYNEDPGNDENTIYYRVTNTELKGVFVEKKWKNIKTFKDDSIPIPASLFNADGKELFSQRDVVVNVYADGEYIRSVNLKYPEYKKEDLYLPILNRDGKEIEYTVKENDGIKFEPIENGGFGVFYLESSPRSEDTEGKFLVNYEKTTELKGDKEYEKIVVTNDFKGELPKKSLKVKINWVDKNHSEDKVVVRLIRDFRHTNELIEITGPEWTGSFDNLTATDANGKDINYTVEVQGGNFREILENRVGIISRGDTDKYRINYIKNGDIIEVKAKYIADDVELKNIIVQKTWIGVTAPYPDPLSARPKPKNKPERLSDNTVVKVELIVNGEPSGITEIIGKYTFWDAEFHDLYVKDEKGNPIEYSIREVGEKDGIIEVEGKLFKSVITKNSDTNYEIVNTLIGPAPKKVEEIDSIYKEPKTDVKVTKEWTGEHFENEVEIILFANGEKIDKSVKLNAKNNWTYVFKDLDSLKGGKTIVYTVKEVGEVEGTLEAGGNKYKVEYLGNQKEGFVVKNSRVDEVIDLTDNTSKEKTSNIKKKQNSIPKTAVARTSFLTFVASISGAVVLKKLKKED